MQHLRSFFLITVLLLVSCGRKSTDDKEDMKKVTLVTLDPGHFHAALVQKNMYESVSPKAYVFAPGGKELNRHLEMIDNYNNRKENPTSWEEKVYTGEDFFEEFMIKRPGNVVVLSGNNREKTDYILKCAESGINILADKPMVISPGKFPLLEKAFRTAAENDVLLYDIMTERYEITTMLQRELSQNSEIFGELIQGSPGKPAITKESVHHFFKYVSGSPLKRPPWYFDTSQQGEGIVDVTTHLVDLVQWECYPGMAIDKNDIEIIDAGRWPTALTAGEYELVTGLDTFPSYLDEHVSGNILNVYANGEINYRIKDTHAKVRVEWKFRAPEGGGDTHYSIMRGTLANLIIRQGEEENYKPVLYLERKKNSPDFKHILEKALGKLPWQGIGYEIIESGKYRINIPDKYKTGHEAHFGQVTEKYLQYLEKGNIPEWEIPNMIAKYYTTTQALSKALKDH
ncbi:MAG: oxidoreductase [Bacteroidales bacterium]|nr:oxidoreductase [Bacteroidales bacterium]